MRVDLLSVPEKIQNRLLFFATLYTPSCLSIAYVGFFLVVISFKICCFALWLIRIYISHGNLTTYIYTCYWELWPFRNVVLPWSKEQ